MHIYALCEQFGWSGKYYQPALPRMDHLAQQFQRFSPDDPEERCGFLIGIPYAVSITSMREVLNTHWNPAEHFRILHEDYLQMQVLLARSERTVLGAVHTHPGRDRNGWLPSADDLARAVKQPGHVHAVYHPYTRRITTYNERGIGFTTHIR